MEYGEFNSINTSLVEYERTTKKLPTMKTLGGSDASKKEGKAAAPAAQAVEPVKDIDFQRWR